MKDAVADFYILQVQSKPRLHLRCSRCRPDRGEGYRVVFTFSSEWVAKCCYCDENIEPGSSVAVTRWDPQKCWCHGHHGPRRMKRRKP